MKTIKELKQKYDELTVKDIEKKAKSTHGEAKKIYANFIEILFYLERTQRFKENRRHKKSTFKDYLSFEYSIRWQTYHEARLAYSNFPQFSEKYTPQLVGAIKKKCGSDKTPQVIKAIEEKSALLKKPLSRKKIQKIIDDNRKPIKPAPPRIDVKMLEDKVVKFQELTKGLEKAVVSKDEQIAKLKKMVKLLQAENKRLNAENKRLQPWTSPVGYGSQLKPINSLFG